MLVLVGMSPVGLTQPRPLVMPPGQAQGPLPAPRPPLVPTGRRRTFPIIPRFGCQKSLGNASTSPPPGDHKGPPHIRPSALAPTDRPDSFLKVHHCAPMDGRISTPPPPGDHKGPPHIRPSALAPTETLLHGDGDPWIRRRAGRAPGRRLR